MTSKMGELYERVRGAMNRPHEYKFDKAENVANDEFVKYLMSGSGGGKVLVEEDSAIVRTRHDVAQMILDAFKDHERYQVMSDVYSHKKDKNDEYEVSFRVRVRPYDVIADLKRAVGK